MRRALVRVRSVTPDQVFAKYIQALGGAAKLAASTSFVARGDLWRFQYRRRGLPIEIDAKAPNQRMQIVRAPDADNIKTYDGRKAWVAEGLAPAPADGIDRAEIWKARVSKR